MLVGGGTDVASVNIGIHSGMWAQVQKTAPWLFWSWCFSHLLELACKDACTSKVFTEINEMFLRLFYLYNNSDKKSSQLTSIVDELKDVYYFPKSGSIPIRSRGTRWITHKRKSRQRIIDRYRSYITHLESMVNENSVKAADRANLTGYHRKWV